MSPVSTPASAGDVWTVRRALGWTAERFGREGMRAARLEAEVLLAFALGLRRLDLYLQQDRPLDSAERACFRDLVRRRLAGEPSAYLTGAREFYSLPFQVTRAVLIPRPDTETLVDWCIGFLRTQGGEAPRCMDLGTGSGCIACCLSRLTGARSTALELDPGAAAVARANVVALGLQSLVEIVEGDGPAAPFPPDLRLLVSNPPYIAQTEFAGLPAEVRDWEPRVALVSGSDGLDMIRAIVRRAPDLPPGAALALEVGHAQAGVVQELIRATGAFRDSGTVRDLAGIERVVWAIRHA